MAYYAVCMASFSQPCVWVLSVLFAAVIQLYHYLTLMYITIFHYTLDGNLSFFSSFGY